MTSPRTRPAQPLTPFREAQAVWTRYQAREITAAEGRKLIRPHAWAARSARTLSKTGAVITDPLGYEPVRVWWEALVLDDQARQRRERRYAARKLRDARQLAKADGIKGLRAADALEYARPKALAPSPRQQLQDAYVQRWQANAVAQAVWATHHGEREWLMLSRSVQTVIAAALGEDVPKSTRPPSGGERTHGSPTLSGDHLDIRVPACPEIHYYGDVLRLLRADLGNLEADWGLDVLRRADALRRKTGFEAGESRNLDELVGMISGHARRPNLAMSWHGYLSSPRLSNIYLLHATERPTVQRAAGKSGDLGEAALLVSGLCRTVG